MLAGVGCLGYATWGLDLHAFADALARFAPERLLWLAIFSLACYPVLGWRLRLLLGGRIALGQGTRAALLATGLNSLLPARAGELAKLLYLHRITVLNYPRLLGSLFWERFADLNALLLVALATSLALALPLVLLPLATVVVVAWALVALSRYRPGIPIRLAARLPGARLRRGARSLVRHLRAGLRPRVLGGLGLLTALFWLHALTQTTLLLLWVAELPIGLAAAVAVFVVSTFGLAVPAAPAGFGLFEAAFVVVLEAHGIAREEALASALAAHAVILAPPLVATFLILARSGLPLPRFGRYPP